MISVWRMRTRAIGVAAPRRPRSFRVSTICCVGRRGPSVCRRRWWSALPVLAARCRRRFQEAIGLRETIAPLLCRNGRESAPAEEDLAALNVALADAPPRQRVFRGGWDVGAPDPSVSALLGRRYGRLRTCWWDIGSRVCGSAPTLNAAGCSSTTARVAIAAGARWAPAAIAPRRIGTTCGRRGSEVRRSAGCTPRTPRNSRRATEIDDQCAAREAPQTSSVARRCFSVIS